MSRRAAFTLIELLMVVLVVGVLASIAIPTYTAQKQSAADAHVTTRLEAALRTARAAYTANDGAYPAAATLAAQIADDQPAAASAGTGFSAEVQVEVVDEQRVVLRSQADDETNFMIVDDRSADGRQTSRLRGYRADPAGLAPIVNVVRNPGFESGVLAGSWSPAVGTNPGILVTSDCWRGAYCGQRTSHLAAPSTFAIFSNGGRVPVPPGQKVAVRCAVRITVGNSPELVAYIEDYDADLTQILGSGESARVTDPALGTWYNVGALITPTGSFVNATFRIRFPDLGTVGQVDDCILVIDPPGGKVPAYFDGSYGGGRWVSGPNSTSTGYLAERAGPEW